MAPASGLPQPMYEREEKVLCFHFELLYEAKIMDVALVDPRDKKSGWKYKVHYKGWKNTWDDWVLQAQLRKMTPENQALAKNLKRDLEDMHRQRQKGAAMLSKRKLESGSSTARASEDRPVGTNGTAGLFGGSMSVSGSSRQKRRDADLEKEEQFLEKPAVRIPLPDTLKSILVDDWENVTKDLKLVPLPSKTPISRILKDYFEHESKIRDPNSAEFDILEEIIAGLTAYFNKCIGKLLLYRDERRQFAIIYRHTENPVHELAGKNMVDIYGAEHLLRLLSILPELVAKTVMDKPSVNRLREELTKFGFWLGSSENIDRYMSVPYEQWSAEDVALTGLAQNTN